MGAVVLLLSACVSPAINADGYRGKVMQSAKKMSGLIGAARLAVQLDLDHKMLRTVTDNVVTDAENDAGSVVTALGSVQPPDAASVCGSRCAATTNQACARRWTTWERPSSR